MTLPIVHICAIAKNEGRYIREWVIMHQIVGVSHFTIYDNGSEDDTASILSEFPCVDVIPWSMPKPAQMEAYQHYIDRHHEPAWTMFLDCDEFLFSPSHKTIPEALAAILSSGVSRSAIGVNWIMFGASGYLTYSPEPIIERFTHHLSPENPVNTHIKSLIWMGQEVKLGRDPHYFHPVGGTFNELGERLYGPLSPSHTSTFLRVNHYHTKSKEEWDRRIALGKPDRADNDQVTNPAAFNGYQAKDGEATGPDSIWRFLPQLKEKLSGQR